MKLNGIFGTGSGKTGNAVFATSAGKQIVRTYQPKVTNPNTEAQIEQRAKFKLLSQLAAVFASIIAIPKDGLVSARNMFVKTNKDFPTFENNTATVNLTRIQLTASLKPLGTLEAMFDGQTSTISGAFVETLTAAWDKVLYALFKKTGDATLLPVGTRVIDTTETGDPNGDFSFENIEEGEYVLYAYGMKAKNASGRSTYYNYATEVGENSATLETLLSLSIKNYDFSVTVAQQITAGA